LISGYHAFELNFLAHLYTRTVVTTGNEADNNFCVYFKVTNNSGQESINVLLDFFPPDLLEIRKITFHPGCDGTLEIVVEFHRREH